MVYNNHQPRIKVSAAKKQTHSVITCFGNCVSLQELYFLNFKDNFNIFTFSCCRRVLIIVLDIYQRDRDSSHCLQFCNYSFIGSA